ncbi:MAG: hypothetical protein ACRDFX_13230 [Chloroflexota bacterium]
MNPSQSERQLHRGTEDLKAAIEARRELGPDYEDQVLETFLARVQERLATLPSQPIKEPEPVHGHREMPSGPDLGALVGTTALTIPLLAIAGGIGHTIGIALVIIGWVCVTLLYYIDRWVRFNI